MFKKIHSNRNPEDTIGSELKKEFAVYFGKAGACGKSFIGRYPKFFFVSMILLLLASIGLSLTVCRRQIPVVERTLKSTPKPVDDGFSQIMMAGSALRETIRLKNQVDSIMANKILSKADSAALIIDLDRLRLLNKPFNPIKK